MGNEAVLLINYGDSGSFDIPIAPPGTYRVQRALFTLGRTLRIPLGNKGGH